MARLSFKMIKEASKTFHGWFGITPIQYCPLLSQMHNCPMIFKCDYFQPSGSTYLRSAFFLLSLLKDEEKKQGIVFIEDKMLSTAVAYAASLLNIPCHIILKKAPSSYLKKKLLQFHATFQMAPSNEEKNIPSWTEKLCKEKNLILIPSRADPRSLAADGGTLGIELLKQIPQLKNVIVPMETETIIGGLLFFLKKKFPDSVLIGVSQKEKNISKSFSKKTKQLMDHFLDHHMEVSEESLDFAIKWYLENYLSLLSREGAISLAATLDPSFPELHGPAAVLLSSNCCDPKTIRGFL